MKRLTYQEEARRALEKSIRHWKRMAEGKERRVRNFIDKNYGLERPTAGCCTLCQVYRAAAYCTNSCSKKGRTCPIYLHNRANGIPPSCGNAEYTKASQIYFLQQDGFRFPENGIPQQQTEAFRHAAAKEVAFLEKVLTELLAGELE